MIDDKIKLAIQELSKTNMPEYKKSFQLRGNDEEIFTVTIERKKRRLVTESMAFEARANTISALPGGSPCGCCQGSGRSS
ncbi:MAG: hypothetical protein PHP85_09535 [Gallionella sp.]|nr:hypothetical protein [Gallionella sp.]